MLVVLPGQEEGWDASCGPPMRPRRRRRWSIRLVVLTLGVVPIFQARAADGLVWRTGQGYRFARLPAAQGAGPGFTLLDSKETGITFSNLLTDATAARNRL